MIQGRHTVDCAAPTCRSLSALSQDICVVLMAVSFGRADRLQPYFFNFMDNILPIMIDDDGCLSMTIEGTSGLFQIMKDERKGTEFEAL